MTQEHKENDRKQWIVDAWAGVVEEHQRLEQNGPSLSRYRRTWRYENCSAFASQAECHEGEKHPLKGITVGQEREKTNVEAEQIPVDVDLGL